MVRVDVADYIFQFCVAWIVSQRPSKKNYTWVCCSSSIECHKAAKYSPSESMNLNHTYTMTDASSLDVIFPSLSLSKKSKVSLNSSFCFSLSLSTIFRLFPQIYPFVVNRILGFNVWIEEHNSWYSATGVSTHCQPCSDSKVSITVWMFNNHIKPFMFQ